MSEVTSSQNINSSNNFTDGGVDYDSGIYTITFPAGVTIISFDVPINDDDILESNEDFSINIRSGHRLPDGVTLGSIDKATVTILDNEGKCLYNYVIAL